MKLLDVVKYFFIAVAAVVCFYFAKAVKRFFAGAEKQPGEGDPSFESDILKSATELRMSDGGDVTYAEAKYLEFANGLYDALLAYPFENEGKAVEIVLGMKGKADWYALIENFGLRRPFGVWRNEISLPTALRRYVDGNELAEIRGHLKQLGVETLNI